MTAPCAVLLLVLLGLSLVAGEASESDGISLDEMHEAIQFSLFDANPEIKFDRSQPMTVGNLISHYMLKPVLIAMNEFMAKFPFDTLDKLANHRYVHLDHLRNFNFSRGNARKVLKSVVDVPARDVAIIVDFITEYAAGLLEHFQEYLNIFMLALREFMSSLHPALAWMKPSDGIRFVQ